MKPYSDNVIFWDTEFTSLNPRKGEIISLAMVKPNGEELYLEIEHEGYTSEWVKQHVIPFLDQEKVSAASAAEQIRKFVGPNKPFLVSYVSEYDGIYLYKLMDVTDDGGNKALPFHWIFVDFSSMLFSYGKDPAYFAEHRDEFLKQFDLDPAQYRHHHALDDARMLRDAYQKLIAQ